MDNKQLPEHTHCKKCGEVILKPEFSVLECCSKRVETQLKVIAYKQKICSKCLVEKMRDKSHRMAP